LAYSVFDPVLKDFAFNIIRATNWSGMVGLDIKQDHKSKNYYLLDFNPRFGATSMLALRSGVDFGYLLYKLVVEGKKEYALEYTKKTYRSLFREDVLYAAKRPLAIPKWIIDFFNPQIHYGHNWTDPKPYIRMAMNTIGELKNYLLSGSR
jgi:predicted ATP-grasp superfamily ATP-dependent carboligase